MKKSSPVNVLSGVVLAILVASLVLQWFPANGSIDQPVAAAQVKPLAFTSRLWQDGAVLPYGKQILVEGSGPPEQLVTVSFGIKIYPIHSNQMGTWICNLGSFKLSKRPRILTVRCGSQRLVLRDVRVGAVAVVRAVGRLPKG